MLNRLKNLWNWRLALQAVVLLLVVGGIAIAYHNITRNLQQLGINFGFDFLNSQASFNIRETSIHYQSSDSYGRALVVGLLNSLKVMIASIILATVVGVTVGISRLSSNWLLRQLATVYVEILRNTPLLLQLFFWYSAIFLTLPSPDQQIEVAGVVYFSNNGVTFPWLNAEFSAEFCSLLIGLTLYSGAFIAEIVRGGVLAIPQGQWEASRALGLKAALVMRLVIFPQALRIIIPPLTSQYLNIAKNSSLAIAIAYEDVYALASTTFNQTGRSVEVVLLLMATYLTISLIISAVMNFINQRVRITER